MHETDCQGCSEYAELSRRGFLQAAGSSALIAAAAAPAWLPRVALASSHRSTMRDVIVAVYLRGAADGLTMCVPHGDPAYYAARPTLAVPRPDSSDPTRCTDLDGFFGLAPAMAPLVPVFREGKLLIVHACGSTDATRSHFDAQRFMEAGLPGASLPSGWLGRHLMSMEPLQPNALLRAVGISTGLQRSLFGGPATIPVPDLANFGLGGDSSTRAARQAALADMYAAAGDPLRASSQTTLATVSLLSQINFAGYQPAGGAAYLTNTLGNAMKATAALIKASVGVEAVAIDINGWDTHGEQGNNPGGVLFGLMSTLSNNLLAFHRDMSAGNGTNYIVVVMSEFGRRVAENGSRGTDHGHGSCMLVMGTGVLGGRVFRFWPGLSQDRLFQGLDLDVTIDFRDILGEIVQTRLGNYELGAVFPQYDPVFHGVVG